MAKKTRSRHGAPKVGMDDATFAASRRLTEEFWRRHGLRAFVSTDWIPHAIDVSPGAPDHWPDMPRKCG